MYDILYVALSLPDRVSLPSEVRSMPLLSKDCRVRTRYTALLFALFQAHLALVTRINAQVTGDPHVDDLGPVTRAFAIRNARIVVAPGRTLNNATVVVRNGVIIGVGREVPIPPDADLVEGDSLWIYAGFIDGLSEIGIDVPKIVGAETKAQRPGLPPREWAGILPDRDALHYFSLRNPSVDRARRIGFTVAHVAPPRGMMSGVGAVVLLGGDSTASVLTTGASLVARFDPAGENYPATSMAIMALWKTLYRRAERQRAEIARYQNDPIGRTRPSLDPVLSALSPVTEGSRPVYFVAEDALAIHRAKALWRALKFRLIIAGGQTGDDIVEAVRDENLPFFLSLQLPRTKSDDSSSQSVLGKDDSAFAIATAPDTGRASGIQVRDYRDIESERSRLERIRRWALHRRESLPARLAQESVPFGFMTGNMSLDDIRANLRLMIQRGLHPDRALAALTTNAAEMLGLGRTLGSVEVGKIANMVVTDGDYFSSETQVRMVIVSGTRYRYDADAKRDRHQASDSSAEPTGGAVRANPTLMARREGRLAGDVLIRNGTVLTITRGTLDSTDILVRNGHIASIGRGLAAPTGIHVIDATGKYVMPGIVDAHSHIGISDVNEWTNPVTAEVAVGDVIDPLDISIYRALAGGVTISHAMHGSANAIGGQCQTLKHRYGETDPARLVMEGAPRTIKFALGENPTRVHGRGNNVTPSTRMGVEQVFRRSFMEARNYIAQQKAYAEHGDDDRLASAPIYDLRLETLAAILRGEILVHCHSYRADEILMLMDVFRDFGIRRLVFQHVNEGFKVAPELAAFGAMASVFSDWWSYKFEVYYSTAYNAAVLTRNGVTTSINSDSPELTRHLYHEAAKTMRYGGLTADEALTLITLNPARQLGIEDRVGSIDVGKEADLAIFSGHPTSIYSRCDMTLVDGIVRFDAQEDPDDMRLRVDPTVPVSTSVIREDDDDSCLEGVIRMDMEDGR